MQNLNDSYWQPHLALGGFVRVFAPLCPQTVTSVWQRTVGALGDRSFGADPSKCHSSVVDAVLWLPETPGQVETADGLFHCPDVGYARDWTDQQTTGFLFNCGRFIGSIHDQSDNNSFTFFAEGVPLILDAGACNLPEDGNASSSLGHSCVLIDGRGQAPSGRGQGVSGTIAYLSAQV